METGHACRLGAWAAVGPAVGARRRRPAFSASLYGLPCRNAAPVTGPLLCPDCLEAIVSEDGPRCVLCAAKNSVAAVDDTDGCRECARFDLRFDAALTLGNYDGLMREFVLRIKRQQHESLTLALAKLVWREHGDAIAAWECDLALPVPMHWWRRVWRGTNSPDLLAARMAENLNIDCLPRCVARSRATQPQSELAPGERFHNVRGAFRLRRGYDIRGARVLLVDDILTTGATASEVARVLKRAGAREVNVLVLARTQQSI